MSLRRPVVVDTRLSEIWEARAKAADTLQSKIEHVHSHIGERSSLKGRVRVWPTSHPDAETALRAAIAAKTNSPGMFGGDRTITAIDALRAEIKRLDADARPLSDEYGRTRWSRFFLVVSSNGHIHRDMNCGTCHLDTRYAWLPNLSGLTEADAVNDQGTRLCSVCFPSAPVEWTVGLAKKEDPDKCPGSGRGARFERRHAFCPVCGAWVRASSATGTTPRHKKPKA